MRITKISVKGLFGYLDHEIPLNQESRITIIHGPNGVGKTTILEMIHGLFNAKLRVFYEVPFTEFIVEYDRHQRITVEKAAQTPDAADESLTIGHSDPENAPYHLPAFAIYRRSVYNSASRVPGLRAVRGDQIWFNIETGVALAMDDILDVYEEVRDAVLDVNAPVWLSNLLRATNTRYFKADRLSGQFPAELFRENYGSEVARHIPIVPNATVGRFASDLVRRIKEARERYLDVAFEREDSILERILVSSNQLDQDAESIREGWVHLERQRLEFTDLGLLDREQNSPENVAAIDEEKLKILPILLQDRKAKHEVLVPIAKQLRILTEIVNERFLHKKLTIDRRKGFVFRSNDGNPISLERLSSGEQHELVLLYELLFQVEPDSLILIDEPENSLHVNWQEHFLDDIQRASELRAFDVLIATHSPDIIGDKHDWMVGLGERELA